MPIDQQKMEGSGREFVNKIEAAHFRTNEDTGANLNALFIWNLVRKHFGLLNLEWEELPAHCKTHDEYHVIRTDNGCVRTLTPKDK